MVRLTRDEEALEYAADEAASRPVEERLPAEQVEGLARLARAAGFPNTAYDIANRGERSIRYAVSLCENWATYWEKHPYEVTPEMRLRILRFREALATVA
jgi:hypothetical protein